MKITAERCVFSLRNCKFLCSFLCFISVSAQISHHIVLDESGSANTLSYSLCHPSQVWQDCISLVCLFGTVFKEKRVYFCCLYWSLACSFMHRFSKKSDSQGMVPWVRNVGSGYDAVFPSYNRISIRLFTTIVKELFISIFSLWRTVHIN